MEEILRLHISACAAVMERETGVTQGTLGKRCLNDNTFFARIADGQGFTVRTYDRVMAWFSANWPESTDWPAGVPRPAPDEVASEVAA